MEQGRQGCRHPLGVTIELQLVATLARDQTGAIMATQIAGFVILAVLLAAVTFVQ